MTKPNAIERYKEILAVYVSRDADTIDKFKSFIGDPFTGFGTALHEYQDSPEEMIDQLKKEIQQVPNNSSFKIKWIKEQKVNDEISIVNAKIGIRFKMEGKEIDIDPIRVSMVFQLMEGEYFLIHWHNSLPDQTRSDEIFPGSVEPKRYEEISVLFSDFVGFTNAASTIPARKLVMELNELFIKFDELATLNGLDKIKTIGDSYMAVAGLDEIDDNHAIKCVNWAKDAIGFLNDRNKHSGIKWEMRVGIHTGNAIGGVVGRDKLAFDLWGDTINITSHLEKKSTANKINISAHTYDLVKNDFNCEYRGKIEVKGKGSMDMYFVNY